MTNLTLTSDLSGLLGRVEEATGPDRSIDAALFGLLECTRENTDPDLMRMVEVGEYDAMLAVLDASWVSGAMPARYTASLDAALGFCERVLPGTGWLCGVKPTGGFMAELFRTRYISGVIPRLAYATAKTPALALLAAMLAALIAQGEAGTAEPLSRSGRK